MLESDDDWLLGFATAIRQAQPDLAGGIQTGCLQSGGDAVGVFGVLLREGSAIELELAALFGR
jgi:hypothetical protein